MALPQLNHARYETTIPSTGQEVSYRPYLVKEEKILMLALESNDDKQVMRAVKDVISSCVFEKLDVEELAMFDIESLFLRLRSKSVGETIDLKAKCSECEEMNETTIAFEEIQMPIVNKDDCVIMLTDTVGVTLKYPSYKTISSVDTKDADSVTAAFKLIISSIDSIFDDNGVYTAKAEGPDAMNAFVEQLNNDQFKLISDFFEQMPSLSYDMIFDCTKCGHSNTTVLKGLQSFFM